MNITCVQCSNALDTLRFRHAFSFGHMFESQHVKYYCKLISFEHYINIITHFKYFCDRKI